MSCVDSAGVEIARAACAAACGADSGGVSRLTVVPSTDDDNMVVVSWDPVDEKVGGEELHIRADGEVIRVLPPDFTSAVLFRDELGESGRLEVVSFSHEGEERLIAAADYQQGR